MLNHKPFAFTALQACAIDGPTWPETSQSCLEGDLVSNEKSPYPDDGTPGKGLAGKDNLGRWYTTL